MEKSSTQTVVFPARARFDDKRFFHDVELSVRFFSWNNPNAVILNTSFLGPKSVFLIPCINHGFWGCWILYGKLKLMDASTWNSDFTSNYEASRDENYGWGPGVIIPPFWEWFVETCWNHCPASFWMFGHNQQRMTKSSSKSTRVEAFAIK